MNSQKNENVIHIHTQFTMQSDDIFESAKKSVL